MADTLLRFQIIGREEDDEDVRLNDFIKQLGLIKNTLAEVDRIITSDKTAYYRVIDLKHESPAVLTIKPVPMKDKPDFTENIIDTFMTGLKTIQQEDKAPDEFDFPLLQSMKDLGGLLHKQEITGLEFSINGQFVPLLPTIGQKIDKILGPDEYEEGSVVGMLHQLNLHNKQNTFTVYPTTRQPKVNCYFSDNLRNQVIDAVDHYIEVFGTLRYKRRENFPYAMTAKEIQVYPPEEELPTLWDLRGILSENELVESFSDEW